MIRLSCQFLQKKKYGSLSSTKEAETKLRQMVGWDISGASGPPLASLSATSVYANSHTNLKDVDVYGFDYDFTLAAYKEKHLHPFIYNAAKKYLVEEKGYPRDLLKLKFDPEFAVRGLHFDKRYGTLFKLDFLSCIQRDTITFGRENVDFKRCLELYGQNGERCHLPHTDHHHLRLLSDSFAIPEICLIADAIQHFVEEKIDFHPSYLSDDVQSAVSAVHTSGEMYTTILDQPEKFLIKKRKTFELLQRLRQHNKHTFILTNSPYWFLNKGMEYLMDGFLPDSMQWTDLFDLVITSARKPGFFEGHRHFRVLDVHSGQVKWHKLQSLEDKKVLVQGSLHELTKKSGWKGDKILYFGDHLHADLVAPAKAQGWKTCACLPEIEEEIKTLHTPEYENSLGELLRLNEIQTFLYENCHGQHGTMVEESTLFTVRQRRRELKKILKQLFNTHFGSSFRTPEAPSWYMHQILCHTNLYTSDVTNLLHYPVNNLFLPRRQSLPHELQQIHLDPWKPNSPNFKMVSMNVYIYSYEMDQFSQEVDIRKLIPSSENLLGMSYAQGKLLLACTVQLDGIHHAGMKGDMEAEWRCLSFAKEYQLYVLQAFNRIGIQFIQLSAMDTCQLLVKSNDLEEVAKVGTILVKEK